MTTATGQWVATYHEKGNPANKIKFDLIEVAGRPALLNERGTGSFPFDREMERSGKTWVWESTDPKPILPPQPRDAARDEAIENLKTALNSFPSSDALYNFYSQEPTFEGNVNDGYDFTNEEMAHWCATIKKVLAPPPFTQEQLRIKFTGQTIGDHLYIAEQTIPSVTANEYNGTYRCECHGCRTLTNATIRQLDVLKMRAGLIPTYVCKKPCGVR